MKWDRYYTFETEHDLIDIQRWGYTKKIYESNTGSLYDVLIKNDTVIIQSKSDQLYELSAFVLNCYIKVDSTITISQYMKKHQPENVQYYCDEPKVDTSTTH